MSGERVDFEQATAATTEAAGGRKWQRSSISFPYLDLDTAIEVVEALNKRAGYRDCEVHELAAAMRQTVSGAFRLKLSTARIFGLTEKGGDRGIKLTSLGLRIVENKTEPESRAQAFLSAPLYAAIYEKYKGHLLPPTKALERDMAFLGVSERQTDKARQAFERSARQAGFFAQGEDRLVEPRFDHPPETKPAASAPPTAFGGGPGGGDRSGGGKPLEYQLIDLLNEQMPSEIQRAVMTLIQFLKSPHLPRENNDETAETQTADDNSSAA